jgi:hypothetical protein
MSRDPESRNQALWKLALRIAPLLFTSCYAARNWRRRYSRRVNVSRPKSTRTAKKADSHFFTRGLEKEEAQRIFSVWHSLEIACGLGMLLGVLLTLILCR